MEQSLYFLISYYPLSLESHMDVKTGATMIENEVTPIPSESTPAAHLQCKPIPVKSHLRRNQSNSCRTAFATTTKTTRSCNIDQISLASINQHNSHTSTQPKTCPLEPPDEPKLYKIRTGNDQHKTIRNRISRRK